MKGPEKGHRELLVIAKSGTLVDPTCEEGGDAKLGEGAGANAELATVCENGPADFCITEKKEGADEEELSALSILAQVARVGRPPKLNGELKSRVCFLLGLGLSRRQAALAVDIDQATITHAAQGDPDFSRALERAEEFSKMRPTLALAAAGLKNWRAAAWELRIQKKQPLRRTPEEMEAEHQQDVLRRQYNSKLIELEETLREQREEAKRLRNKDRYQQIADDRQAQIESLNPHIYPRKKKK